MPQQKVIKVKSSSVTVDGVLSVVISTFDEQNDPLVNKVTLVDSDAFVGQLKVISGDFVTEKIDGIDFSFDVNGDLIIKGKDAANYSINEDGDLVFEK